MAIVSESQALELLKQGDIVALPTETVYGLAGRVDQDEALNKIFTTKERPFFDPLIVHVQNQEQAQEWAIFDSMSSLLAKHFWPGPLTLVLPKKETVSSLINNGGPTVAVRAPNHPAFQNILKQLQVPLAAPSANMFGKTSPTEAQHVEDEFAGKVPVVDGGLCFKGIESTVIEVNASAQKISILRPGIINTNEIENFLQEQGLQVVIESQTSLHSPGHLKNHYQPVMPLALIDGPLVNKPQPLSSDAKELLPPLTQGDWLELPVDKVPTLAARHLYGSFRDHSQKQQALWIRLLPHWKTDPAWAGFLDRIQKAASITLTFEKGHWRVLSNS